jgi:hypothetical protein
MRTVWKFPFEFPPPGGDDFAIRMPCGAVPLTVMQQGKAVCVWAYVDSDAPLKLRQFRVCGTGHGLDGPREWMRYVGSWQEDGMSVWHLFEVEMTALDEAKQSEVTK